MSLGVAMIAMLLATIGILSYAVLRKPTLMRRVDYDIVLYRDQLAEIDKDIERGLLTRQQAVGATSEVHRRILNADATEKNAPDDATWLHSKILALFFIIIMLPFGALSMYAFLGSPSLVAQPYAARQDDPQFIKGMEAEQLATQLEKQPDANGYKKLSLMYFELGYDDKAVDAYQKALASMKPEEQKRMIQKLADRLAEKMKENPDDYDGWRRLANAYRVLGQTEHEHAADARANAIKPKN